MRLFIAIELPEWVKAGLEKDTALLRRACIRGGFTRRVNFHLTLAFLGETDACRAGALAALLESCAPPPFPVTVEGLGRFPRREGDLLWRRVQAGPALYQAQTALAGGLARLGFAPDRREYLPHLTLARRAALRDGVDLEALSRQMPRLDFEARGLSLMRSELLDGKRVYTPLYRSGERQGT